jgi:hypothetical protein
MITTVFYSQTFPFFRIFRVLLFHSTEYAW